MDPRRKRDIDSETQNSKKRKMPSILNDLLKVLATFSDAGNDFVAERLGVVLYLLIYTCIKCTHYKMDGKVRWRRIKGSKEAGHASNHHDEGYETYQCYITWINLILLSVKPKGKETSRGNRKGNNGTSISPRLRVLSR